MGTKHQRCGGIDTDRFPGQISLGPLGGYVGFMLRRIQTVVFADFIASLGRLDLRPAQYALLEVIDANPGLRQSDAAAVLGVQKANFVGLVHQLERRSLVRRQRSQADRRSYSLLLEPAGAQLLDAARRMHREQESRLAEQLGSDGRHRLLTLLSRLADAR